MTLDTFLMHVFLGIVIGYFMGWERAHIMIAKECERLGGFFVEKKVYRCVKIEEGQTL